MATTTIDTLQIGGRTLAFREQGTGPAVVLLHGWPTSSFLWRGVTEPIARSNRVVAPDLPGFGASDKPLDVHYGFELFEQAIDGLLDALGIAETAIVGHDLGGPIALHWALNRPEWVTKVALLNTLVYPEMWDGVTEFVRELTTPGPREHRTSRVGLEQTMRLGLADASHLTPELANAVTEPFADDDSRLALARAGIGLELDGFAELSRRLPELRAPLRLIYGEQDRFFPEIAHTFTRIARDVPHAEVTSLPGVGHFLQEEAPDQVGELLARFLAA
jgi:pimeloyl-ACP methyl ester carboxylesterase